MKKWIFLILIIAAAAYGGWVWWHGDTEAPQYLTTKVAQSDLKKIVTATGTLNPVVNVQVGSQISGRIIKLYADFNTPVKKGQVVAQLDPSTYQAIVDQAKGNLASAEAKLELAKLTAKRKKDLVAQHAAAQADLDAANADMHQGEAQVEINKASVERAQVDLDNCTIHSPVDGIVISRTIDVGQTVAAGFSAPVLFTIANDLSKMQIDSNVAEADIGNAKVKQKVDFTVDAYPYRTFHGAVKQVRNAATTVSNVVTYDVVINVNNDDLWLKPGMTADVSIVIANHHNVLNIPNSALRFRPLNSANGEAAPAVATHSNSGGRHRGEHGEKTAKKESKNPIQTRTVYVLPTGATEPKPVEVKLGITDSISTEVLSGLKKGEDVVTGVLVSSASERSTNPFQRHGRHH